MCLVEYKWQSARVVDVNFVQVERHLVTWISVDDSSVPVSHVYSSSCHILNRPQSHWKRVPVNHILSDLRCPGCRDSFRASKIADVPGATATQDGLGRASLAFTFQSSTVSVRLCTISASKPQLNDLYTAIGAL